MLRYMPEVYDFCFPKWGNHRTKWAHVAGMVAHTCNLSTLGGQGGQIT